MQPAPSHPLDLFASVLEETGGTVQRVSEARQIAAVIAGAAREQGVREVLYERTDLIEDLGLKLLLAAHGVELLPVDQAGDKAPHVRVALTGAELAIAETGTLLVGGRPGGWGLASVLPWIHLVVLPADAVVAGLTTAFERFEARLAAGDGDWVWITGPSRTADIGHTLVLGAHGPNSLRVMVVE
jgi:L-lactate utilization protein LutC